MDQREKNKIVTTPDIKKTLLKYAKVNKVKFSSMDFKLVNYRSGIRTKIDQGFIRLNKGASLKYEDKKYMVFNDQIELRQLYKIIPLEKKLKSQFFNLNYKIVSDSFCCNPFLIIKRDSLFNTNKYKAAEMYRALFYEVIKIKAYNNIIIDLFNQKTVEDLKRFIMALYKKKFIADVKIKLFDGIEPEESAKADIIEHYKLKESSDDKKIVEVNEGELVIEYVKPLFGRDGFNARGKIVDSSLYGKQVRPRFEVDDETITIEETEKHIHYYAKTNGYVGHSDKFLEVKKQYVIGDVSKCDKAATDDESNDIEVVVAENDMTKDGVGAGVELVSNKITITGAVGKNAVVNAKEATIDGMTHASATVYARKATVNRHLGTVRAGEVHIRSLEGGTIYATYAKIDNILSGTIFANIVEIDNLKSNTKIYASESITIDTIIGEDNLLAIDVDKIATLQKKASFIVEGIEKLKEQIEGLSKIDKFKHKVKELSQTLEKQKEELDKTLYDPLKAKIKIHSPVNGHNKIYFNLHNRKPKGLIIETKTKAGFEYKDVFLEDKEENKEIVLHPSHESVEYKE